MTALLGPPWTEVGDPRGVLFADPPALTACGAVAIAIPEIGLLHRIADAREVGPAAKALAEATERDVLVYRGAIQTQSGLWLWPFQQDTVTVEKADLPLSRRAFALAIERLERALRATSRASARRTLRRALDQLRRPWPTMTAAQVDNAIAMLATAVRDIPGSRDFREGALGQLQQVAASVAQRSALGATAARGLAFTFSPVERELARRIGRNGSVFISDEFARRSERFSRAARRIVGEGAAEGLGYRQIAQDLAVAMRGAALGRDENYYRAVASAAVAQARSYGQMVGYGVAEIDSYTWEAVLDERTCETCRWLHGQQFPVESSLTRTEAALRSPDPEAAVNMSAWYRVVGDQIHVSPRGGPLGPPVAQIQQRGFGVVDRVGVYRPVGGGAGSGGGAMVPPAHASCRCTTVPVL
jgi:SPP1 gp7 family putative phage head morphogenesis protein